MARTLFLSALAANSGKAEAAAAMLELVKSKAEAPVLFRPVSCLCTARQEPLQDSRFPSDSARSILLPAAQAPTASK